MRKRPTRKPTKSAGPGRATDSRRAAAARPPSSDAGPLTVGSLWDLFYGVIRRIPSGKVATYGAVAEWAGKPRTARHVGFALAAFKGSRGDNPVPWQRVVGAKTKAFGSIAIRDPIGAAIQQQLLEAEGVVLDARGRISLETFGWRGPRSHRAAHPIARAMAEEELAHVVRAGTKGRRAPTGNKRG